MTDMQQTIAALAAVLAIALAAWVGFSALEARAYERVTGIEVSVLDAMVLQLRVSDCGD